MTAFLEGEAKSLSFAVRSRRPEVATKKFNVFARRGTIIAFNVNQHPVLPLVALFVAVIVIAAIFRLFTAGRRGRFEYNRIEWLFAPTERSFLGALEQIVRVKSQRTFHARQQPHGMKQCPVNAEEVLDATYPSMLIIEERESNKIVVGVPHHAPAGITKLRCAEHEVSDENTGHLGRYLAEALKCSSVMACNYTFDVNKCLRTDYAMQIAKWAPDILVEIHAHSGAHGGRDVEISCGSESANNRSVQLATKLQRAMGELPKLKISVNGDFKKIPRDLRASRTATINDSRWDAYHLELAPKLRIPGTKTGRPPAIGFAFCDKLAEVLRELYESAGPGSSNLAQVKAASV